MEPRITRRGATHIAVTRFARTAGSGAKSDASIVGVIIGANIAAMNGAGAITAVAGNKLDLMFRRG
jgi:hypothetical protein